MTSPMLIKINLLPPKTGNRLMFYWGIGFIIIAILGGLVSYYYISQRGELNQLRTVNSNLKSIVREYENEMAPIDPIQKKEKDIIAKSEKVKELEKKQIACAEAINEINQAAPQQVLITGMEINAQKVVVTGLCPDHNQVADLINSLKISSRFKNVLILLSKIDERTNQAKFTIEMDWEASRK